MIIYRERRNGTMTDEAGKEIIEFLDMTCSYLLKNEPDFKKEVRGIMRPIVMTQMERAEYEIVGNWLIFIGMNGKTNRRVILD